MNQARRILYVEDDAGLRRLVQRALERRGFEVEVAESADAGLAAMAGAAFDLIAIDHQMPGKDGLVMLAEIVAMPSSPPVVFVTGTDDARLAVTALKAGAADFVIKTVGETFFDLLASSFEAALEKVALVEAKTTAEEELREANARLEALLGEVHHRVGNSLQLVSAFMSMQAAKLDNAEARQALQETQRRIQAIVQVHHRLYTSHRTDILDLDAYLHSLVEGLRKSLAHEAGNVALTLDADPVAIKPDHAVSVGVIVTELVSNAAKYAFDKDRGGTIDVTVRRAGESGYVVAVGDDGRGFDPSLPAQGSGLGMRIVEAMAKSLRTSLEHVPVDKGSRVAITVPG